jgi:hypothetical protein
MDLLSYGYFYQVCLFEDIEPSESLSFCSSTNVRNLFSFKNTKKTINKSSQITEWNEKLQMKKFANRISIRQIDISN